ncbi:unnamed protein product [Gongylonema pulchrum]|uniref:Transcriptional regulator n=1 Tax=Gongylonema pulchrum TaxID=637853 RepID=A0A183DBN2_9BILA|nr:unnamed protein product [Gongylonema pulchrum]
MEVQCPFRITLQRIASSEFAEYFFDKFDKNGSRLAMVISKSMRSFRNVWNQL